MQSYYTIPDFLNFIDNSNMPQKAILINILKFSLELYKVQLNEYEEILSSTVKIALAHLNSEVRRNTILCLAQLFILSEDLCTRIVNTLNSKQQKLFEIYKNSSIYI